MGNNLLTAYINHLGAGWRRRQLPYPPVREFTFLHFAWNAEMIGNETAKYLIGTDGAGMPKKGHALDTPQSVGNSASRGPLIAIKLRYMGHRPG